MGSARESRGWYYAARHIVGDAVATHRMEALTQIIRLLLTMIPQQRSSKIREVPPPYLLDPGDEIPYDPDQLHSLLQTIPLP